MFSFFVICAVHIHFFSLLNSLWAGGKDLYVVESKTFPLVAENGQNTTFGNAYTYS